MCGDDVVKIPVGYDSVYAADDKTHARMEKTELA